MNLIIEGRYFPIGRAKAEIAQLVAEHDKFTVRLMSGQELDAEIESSSQRLAGVARKIWFSDGGAFESTDDDNIDRMLGIKRGFFARLSNAETSWRYIVPALVLTFVLLIGIFRYGLPAMAIFAAWATPGNIVSLIDTGTLDAIDRILLEESNLQTNRKNEIERIFKELVEFSDLEQGDLTLLFRDGGKLGPNAMALPGGTVIITDQLIGLAKHDDEIAGVLAHEIGHVEHRHSLRQLYRVLGVAFMVGLIGGDSGQIVEDIIAQATVLESFSYSRAFEIESDAYSVALMVKARKDPVAFLNLLDRISPNNGAEDTTGWLSTHPSNADRRERIETEVGRIRGGLR